MLKPIFTEKSTRLAKLGKYTFLVSANATKNSIKNLVFKFFGVKANAVKTLKIGEERKRNFKGFKIVKKAFKKAVVTLKDGKTLDIFEEKK